MINLYKTTKYVGISAQNKNQTRNRLYYKKFVTTTPDFWYF